MKKILVSLMIAVLCMTAMLPQAVLAQSASLVYVYATEGEGLALKAAPDINSGRYLLIPENTKLSIDQVSGGWGHTTYQGYNGWVFLQYTHIRGVYNAQMPTSGFITPTAYLVSRTGKEGLELRVEPTIYCSTFGPVPDGMPLTVTAIVNNWAFTYYNGNYGWVDMTYLDKWNMPKTPTTDYFYVTVYNTEGEGLSLKASDDINSARIMTLPENTVLTIDSIDAYGWGHTSFAGYSGWVALRYTRVLGSYPTPTPGWGAIGPRYYTVSGTIGEGLELRTRPTTESSSFGQVPEGTTLYVTAINNMWAYTTFNGNAGWCNLTYLR